MTILDATVSRFSLTVDATATIEVMLDNADNPWGRRLHDALAFATATNTVVYPVAPYARCELPDFRPDAPHRPDLRDVEARSAGDVLVKLQDAGYIEARTVLSETSSQAYLSDGRTVTAVQVLRPFALVSVDYHFARDTRGRTLRQVTGDVDRWWIAERSYVVPAGWYLVGETGDYVTELVGVAGMDGDPDGCVFELEGFGASQCDAGCGSCDARWTAYDASWTFQPEECDAETWAFDDADDVDETTNTIACPACTTGRVGFFVF